MPEETTTIPTCPKCKSVLCEPKGGNKYRCKGCGNRFKHKTD